MAQSSLLRFRGLVFLALLFAATPISAQQGRVVILSLDGFAAARLNDETLELPNLRGLARSGAWAESSETVYPGTDHPAHASLITGVPPRDHGVVGNRVLNRETGEYFHITNKPRSESLRAETLFDAAKKRGLVTAALFWPETRDDPAVDYGIPLVLTGDGKADPKGTAPDFLEELRKNDVPIDLFFQWYNDLPLQTTADRILTRAAAYVIRTYKPHLLALRLPALDRYQHQYGADHYLSKAALTAADYNVGILRRSLEEAGLAKETTLFVVSDHGFHEVNYSVSVDPLFRESRLNDKVKLHAGYWSVFVELLPGFDPSRDQKDLDEVLRRALSLEGVSRIVRPAEFEAIGLPRYEDNPYILGHYLILGDADTRVVIDSEQNSTRRVRLERPLFGHSLLPTHEAMFPLLVVGGRGVREGIRIGHVRNSDVAPTVCELLGLSMTNLEGRVLSELLDTKR